MALFVILNIIVVLVTLFIDMNRHRFQYISFSAILLAITVNSVFNQILLNKITFISIFTMLMYMIWFILQQLLDRHYGTFFIHQQKFIAIVLTTMLSISLVVIYHTGDQSYYMSLPYLAPAIFVLGAIILCSQMIGLPYLKTIFKKFKIRQPLLLGVFIIIFSFILMVILTPFWYIILVVNLSFFAELYLEKIFITKK
ncbi:hypothetical protein [Staphylococcus canis]|uniref:Uncharacterized protein n=1 Tax=Staphylococcus canis TaxID=2724942 RepID=A0ABS0T5T2_9STAP|nr:hypothetical protein [Staphylococcus canis]MBI5974022.1 hypothetical protein [Staphylococcus canis]